MKRFFVVDSDCLGIIERLRSIDKDYFVVFDIDKKKFELHNKSQFSNSYCLTFPFDEIDERMVCLTLKTRVQNSDKFFQEMEKENERNRKTLISTTIKAFKERFYDG